MVRKILENILSNITNKNISFKDQRKVKSFLDYNEFRYGFLPHLLTLRNEVNNFHINKHLSLPEFKYVFSSILNICIVENFIKDKIYDREYIQKIIRE